MNERASRPSPIVLRLAAAIIDYTIALVMILPILLIWTTSTGDQAQPTTAANWTALAVFVAYPVVSLARSGRTIGKRICSLVVERTDGGPVGWVRSVIRFVAAFAPLLAGVWLTSIPSGAWRTGAEFAQVGLTVLIYAAILVDPRRRGIHDRIAGTVVVCVLPALLDGAFED